MPRTIFKILLGIAALFTCLMLAESIAARYYIPPAVSHYRADINQIGLPSELPDLEDVRPKPKGEYRVLCLGASNVKPEPSSLGPGTEDGFPGWLKTMLPQKYRVINAGVPGFTSYQTLQFYRYIRTRRHLEPDMVLIHEVFNDAMKENLTDEQRRWEKERAAKVAAGPLRLVSIIRDKMLPRVDIKPAGIYRVPPDEYVNNLRQLVALCREDGARQVYILELPYGPVVNFEDHLSALRQSGLSVINMRGGPLDSLLHPDEIHFTGSGYREIARELTQKFEPSIYP